MSYETEVAAHHIAKAHKLMDERDTARRYARAIKSAISHFGDEKRFEWSLNFWNSNIEVLTAKINHNLAVAESYINDAEAANS